ncbi:hypothetical protein, partial [Ralstonia sp.]|uniref:hypothetical protein n=1 Tax=Ralstonia sp. TaxID=54061 RepID=UPI00257B2FB4
MTDPQHDTQSPRQRRGLIVEHHIQTVGIGLLTVALAWSGSTLRAMYDSMIESRAQMNDLASDLGEMRAEMTGIRQQLTQVPTQREIDARF